MEHSAAMVKVNILLARRRLKLEDTKETRGKRTKYDYLNVRKCIDQ